MEMFKAGDVVELDLNSPMFDDMLLDLEYEMGFLKDMGLVPNKCYTVTRFIQLEDEDGDYCLLELEGVQLSWGSTRFKHAVLTLENE